MKRPIIQGLIRRRLLVNYRVDADVLGRFLPAPFRPKLHHGFAIAGICLIRLEQIRPEGMPGFLGISSENAAHRMAVLWDDPQLGEQEGVYIPRRDTGALFNHLAGGRLFPGAHHLADFQVTDDVRKIEMNIQSRDRRMSIHLKGATSDQLPPTSCFESLEESSRFFERGHIGFSPTRDCCRLDGLRLETLQWQVQPLELEMVTSTFFSDESIFPAGSVQFDHALIMRDIPHRWHPTDAPGGGGSTG